MKLCHWLQNKALIDRALPDAQAVEQAMMLSDCSFTCLHTTQPWGPDQQLCAPERCQPGQACFELSPRDPSAWVS